MIVVLILTSIVVGLAFMALTLVQKHMESIQKNINRSTELHKLESSLWLDFNHYNTINFNNDVLQFSSAIDSVNYHITKEHIIKNRDTFFIPIENTQVFFKGAKAHTFVDALKLKTTKAFQNQEIFVFKQNDAVIFMK